MKSAKRRRVDVNLDELDRVLDGARQAPLSEADCDKLKSALHALAAMLGPARNTEKTSAVLEATGEPGNRRWRSAGYQRFPATRTRAQRSGGVWRGAKGRHCAPEVAAKRAFPRAKSDNVFGQARKSAKMFRAGLYARVSTNDQQTLPMQSHAMREYAARRGWTIAMQVREVGSGAAKRQAREKLLEAARRRQIDVVLVWRLDHWGRSVTDLLATLQELEHLGVGFVSLTEALDLTTPAGRAMAGLLAIFAEFERETLRERTRAGLAHARENGKRLGRPATAAAHAAEIRKLHRAGVSKSEIARRLQVGRTSVRRILTSKRA